ncbi:hypothetical protein DXA98_03080 [Lachnospiraceae bacterium OF09-6]|nr:hypothetical protein DXA98_03080 [Lachnospiraceae bacterium OF09-6]
MTKSVELNRYTCCITGGRQTLSYEFYLDIYFLENLVINDTVLRMIAILEKKNCPRIRRFLTAAGGSLALCLGMMLGMYRVRVLTAIVCMAVETLMTTAAFSWSGWKTFMYRAVIFRLLSLLAEGSWQILRDYFHMPFPYSMAAGIFCFFYPDKDSKKRRKGAAPVSGDFKISWKRKKGPGTLGQR